MGEDAFLDMEWEDRLSGFSGFGPDSPDDSRYYDDDIEDEPPEDFDEDWTGEDDEDEDE
jgi:hypothetical protein